MRIVAEYEGQKIVAEARCGQGLMLIARQRYKGGGFSSWQGIPFSGMESATLSKDRLTRIFGDECVVLPAKVEELA